MTNSMENIQYPENFRKSYFLHKNINYMKAFEAYLDLHGFLCKFRVVIEDEGFKIL